MLPSGQGSMPSYTAESKTKPTTPRRVNKQCPAYSVELYAIRYSFVLVEV